MGLHTWFKSDITKYRELDELYSLIDDKIDYKGITVSFRGENLSQQQLNYKIYILEQEIDTEFHDCFRTSRRNEDGTYTDDIIYSKEECFKWLEDNINTVSGLNEERLNEFWNKYPNGVIEFS